MHANSLSDPVSNQHNAMIAINGRLQIDVVFSIMELPHIVYWMNLYSHEIQNNDVNKGWGEITL